MKTIARQINSSRQSELVCRTIFPMLVSGSRRRISSPKPSTLGCLFIDIQITGANLTENFNFASKLMQHLRYISGTVDFPHSGAK